MLEAHQAGRLFGGRAGLGAEEGAEPAFAQRHVRRETAQSPRAAVPGQPCPRLGDLGARSRPVAVGGELLLQVAGEGGETRLPGRRLDQRGAQVGGVSAEYVRTGRDELSGQLGGREPEEGTGRERVHGQLDAGLGLWLYDVRGAVVQTAHDDVRADGVGAPGLVRSAAADDGAVQGEDQGEVRGGQPPVERARALLTGSYGAVADPGEHASRQGAGSHELLLRCHGASMRLHLHRHE